MESYRTEEEQVEALRRWWNENGRSTMFAIVLVLAGVFGWQGWQRYEAQRSASASDLYQQMLEAVSMAEQGVVNGAPAERLASQLRNDYGGTTYAQFAALHQARMAVAGDDLDAAENHLRWVLGKAGSGSDTAMVAQLRLARVLAARGETEQALKLLAPASGDTFPAASALARGDVLAAAGRDAEALAAYRDAQALVQEYPGQLDLLTLEAKIQSLVAAGGEAGA
ncbi:tetratricopeptide repeat protein [Haliea sp. E1-2-M8]|uniref:YfgM family protein n=1 Tax=Haliea sp. E1-2-M8 TaxID=3064706 RepID=UPI002725F926|nr:tetratricopeptide repeat protein [Haliea sp. E1-2-M8]MDO8862126.1 tetratricopeptide repeat protein [Haliea sp. E1-2-M8]